MKRGICLVCNRAFYYYPCEKKKYCSCRCNGMANGTKNLWWSRGNTPPTLGRKATQEERKKISEALSIKPKLDITYNLAYFIGAFLGDGCCYLDNKKGNYCVRVYCGLSKQFAERCAECLRDIGLHPHTYKTENQWLTLAYSKTFATWLKLLKENIEKIRELVVEREHKKGFLRGLIDAEGTTHIRSPKGAAVIFSNTNEEIIKLSKEFLDELGYHYSVHIAKARRANRKDSYNRKDCYYIYIGRFNKVIDLLEGTVKGEILRKKLEKVDYEEFWTEEEERILRKLYPKTRKEDLLKTLPRRSWGGIRWKAHELGIKRDICKYDDSIRDILDRMYNSELKSIEEIAKELKIGITTAYNYLNKFGIKSRTTHQSKSLRSNVELICLNCQRKFITKQWRAKQGQKFCSNACRLTYYKEVGVPA
jgi:intein-encoded DNA endonuclease-like protein